MRCRDDREDVVLAAEVPLDPAAANAAPVPSSADIFAHTLELEAYQREVEAQQRRQMKEQQRLEREMQHLSVRGVGPETLARSGGSGRGGYVAPGPALEVTVMRVVGCDMLTNGMTGRDFTIVTYCGSTGGWAMSIELGLV